MHDLMATHIEGDFKFRKNQIDNLYDLQRQIVDLHYDIATLKWQVKFLAISVSISIGIAVFSAMVLLMQGPR